MTMAAQLAQRPDLLMPGAHRPAFLRLSRGDGEVMPETKDGSDDASWVKMQIDVAVTKEKVDALSVDLRRIGDDLRNVYATKAELKDIAEDVAGLKSSQSWIVRLIVGAVVAAVLGMIIVKGGAVR